MPQSELERIVIDPPGAHRASVIWLHGLGADGRDFEPIVPHLGLPPDHGVRFIFPHAPMRPITVNGGMVMRGWYDIPSFDLRDREDEQGVLASAEAVAALIDAEHAAGVAHQRVVLAGFSQGGAVTLACGLRYPHRLAGLCVLSSYLPIADRLERERSDASLEAPILMAHGRLDPIVPFAIAIASRDRLLGWGYAVEWHEYPMPHSVCAEEVALIGGWLARVLAA